MKTIKYKDKEIKIPTSTEDAFNEVDGWFLLWKRTLKAYGKWIFKLIFEVIIFLVLLKYIWIDNVYATYGFEETIILMLCFFIVLMNIKGRELTNVIKGV